MSILQILKKILHRIKNAFGMSSVWTNSNVKNEFAAKKIPLDLSDSDGVVVSFSKDPASVSWVESRICFKGDRTDIGMTYHAGIMRRYVDVLDDGVSFSDCSRFPTFNSASSAIAANSRMIPYKIYAFKLSGGG